MLAKLLGTAKRQVLQPAARASGLHAVLVDTREVK